MRATLLTLFTVLLALTAAGLLWRGNSGRGPRGAVRILTALTVLVLLLTPISSLLKTDTDAGFPFGESPAGLEEHYRELFENTLNGRGEADLIEGLRELLYATHGIEVKDAQIKIAYHADGTPKTIRITLQGKALAVDPRAVKKTLENILDCDVEVR